MLQNQQHILVDQLGNLGDGIRLEVRVLECDKQHKDGSDRSACGKARGGGRQLPHNADPGDLPIKPLLLRRVHLELGVNRLLRQELVQFCGFG